MKRIYSTPNLQHARKQFNHGAQGEAQCLPVFLASLRRGVRSISHIERGGAAYKTDLLHS